jgi:hypothetical protein
LLDPDKLASLLLVGSALGLGANWLLKRRASLFSARFFRLASVSS